MYEPQQRRVFVVETKQSRYFRTIRGSSKPFVVILFVSSQARTVTSQGRDIVLPRCKGTSCRLDFDEVCRKPTGANDYLVIGTEFETVFLENVPRLRVEDFNVLRRLIVLIDCLYEKRIKLVVGSEVGGPGDVFEGDGERDEVFAWDRSRSRLEEMGSKEWWSGEGRGEIERQ